MKNNIEKTLDITNYFINIEIHFEMHHIYYDDGDHLIKFLFELDDKPNSMIFYYLDDNWLAISNRYKFSSLLSINEFKKIKEEFQNDKGIFDTIFALNKNLEDIEINENNNQKNIYAINLFIELDDKDFNINHLDKIYDYLINKTNFSKKLSSISKIKKTK